MGAAATKAVGNVYTRFVEPCAGTFAMANLAVRNGFKPEQIETSDVSMMTSVLGYAITDQSLAPLEIHAQGFSDEELLDPATALYAQMYLRTSKSAGAEYFHNMLVDLKYRRAEHIASIQKQIDATRELLHGIPEPMNIAFDDILLLNGISATKGEGIRALLNSSLSPMKIENEGFTALVLPVRMKNRA